ncbi:MAG: hypothetical protein JWL83_2104 [Actinomycetia bacterium]|nr:hypothetical protein [Actinomycetes bacterium]
MASEILGQLVTGELVPRDHGMYHARLFEDHEISVHRALRQTLPHLEDLGNREGAVRGGEDFDELLAAGGEALAVRPQPARCPLAQGVVDCFTHCLTHGLTR